MIPKEELIQEVAEAMHDSLVMLGVDPDERSEDGAGNETIGEILARIAVETIFSE